MGNFVACCAWVYDDGEMKSTIEILIAALLAYIAYQNYKINGANFKIQKDKFRLDLFNRRHDVFKALQALITNIMRHGVPTREALNEFAVQTSDAEFLFGEDVKNYLEEVSTKSLKAIHLTERLGRSSQGSGENVSGIADELYELETWLGQQYKNSRKLFRKYLHFSISKDF